jgi:hypothetical protein
LNECLSPVSTTPAISCSPVPTTPGTNLINPCYGFSVIAGVVDTGDKFIACTTTLAINLLPVTTMLVIRVCGVSMEASFHGSSNETIGGRVRLRQPEISLFWFAVVLAVSGASNQGVLSVYGCVFSWWF